jgi:hypothetical protein
MIKDYELLYTYIKALGHPDPLEVQDLEEKGIIVNLNKGKDVWADHLLVADKFAQYFITMDVQQANEFWKRYPDTINVQGKKFKTKTLNKEVILMEYQRLIKYDEKTHEKALKCLEHDKSKGLINTKIDKYIAGEPWVDYEEEEVTPNSNIL